MQIILASQSPRRKELLELMGISKYEIIVSNIQEKMDETLPIKDRIQKLAYQKAEAVFNQTKGDRIVIGADTIVEKNDKIYGKPKDKQDAINMLQTFSNSKVNIITAIAVIVETLTTGNTTNVSFTTIIRALPGVVDDDVTLTVVPNEALTLTSTAIGVNKVA